MKYCNKCGEINNSKYGYCTECRRKVSREWYKNNSDKKKQYALDYLKKNNYKTEKTDHQRILRSIKRKTRAYFKLTDQLCSCGKKATEHHHTTKPIQFDKFIFICHECHNQTKYNLKREV